MAKSWPEARDLAIAETAFPDEQFPERRPFSIDQVLKPDWGGSCLGILRYGMYSWLVKSVQTCLLNCKRGEYSGDNILKLVVDMKFSTFILQFSG